MKTFRMKTARTVIVTIDFELPDDATDNDASIKAHEIDATLCTNADPSIDIDEDGTEVVDYDVCDDDSIWEVDTWSLGDGMPDQPEDAHLESEYEDRNGVDTFEAWNTFD